MSNKIEKSRELVVRLTKEAEDATQVADQAKGAFVELICNKYGIKPKTIELLWSVMDDPISGGYGKNFTRILEPAINKGLVKHVHGGVHSITIKSISSNAWFELGPEGKNLMLDMNGPGWTYTSPSDRFDEKKEKISDSGPSPF